MLLKSPEVLIDTMPSDVFFEDISRHISECGSGDRVSLMTFSFEPSEPFVKGLIRDLIDATERDADVSLSLDGYAFMQPASIAGVYLPSKLQNSTTQSRVSAVNELKDHGVNVSVVNFNPDVISSPLMGRNHIKAHVVKNRLYVGGPNFHGTDRVDLACVIEDEKTANFVDDLIHDISSNGNAKNVLANDFVVEVDRYTDLLFDAGHSGKSIILEDALAQIDSAEDQILFASQYFPTGRVLRGLKLAHKRGVDVSVVHNHPVKHDYLKGLHHAILASNRLRVPKEFFDCQVPIYKPKSHLKALLVDGGYLNVGSHNLISAGVSAGTAEMNIVSRKPETVIALDAQIRQLIT